MDGVLDKADSELPGFRPLDPRDLGAAVDPTPKRPSRAAPAFTPLADEGIAGALTCSRCGAEDRPPARFCRACGAALAPDEPEGLTFAVVREPARKRGRPLVLVAIGVFTLGAAGAVAYALRLQAPTTPAVPAAAAVTSSAPPPVAAVAEPAPPSAQPAPASTPQPEALSGFIADPVWSHQPTPAELWRRYPEQAMNLGLSGAATLDCAATAEGRLAYCRALDEIPLDHGFAAAALEVAPAYRLAPTTRSGAPIAGRRVRVPVSWLIGGKDKHVRP